MNWHEAVDEMYKGNVVKYIGTVNGNVMTDQGKSFCMMRGVIFLYEDGSVPYKSAGHMVYDPDFSYELTGETVNTRDWPNRKREVHGYSRIGLGNV